jgi:hypothetical protein
MTDMINTAGAILKTDEAGRVRTPAARRESLLDEHTREWLAVHMAWSIRAVDVIAAVEAAMKKHGTPQPIRSDNGSEFIAYAIQDWLKAKNVKTIYIRCHRAEQNRPEVSDSKPATLKCGIHIISGFSIKGFPVRVKTSRTGQRAF